MESKKEQFEILSKELLGKLNDANQMTNLEFPFGFKLSEETEQKYFDKGTDLRLITVRSMIVIDNSFKKFKIFPTHDIMKTYIEIQRELLTEWKKEAEDSFLNTLSGDDSGKKEFGEFKKVLSKIEGDINRLSMVAIKEAASSKEAKMLDEEYSTVSQGGFAIS